MLVTKDTFATESSGSPWNPPARRRYQEFARRRNCE